MEHFFGTYKVDPHTHTSETSKCGRLPGAVLAGQYRDNGYDALVVTDHLYEGYISGLSCRDDWDACVDCFLTGYLKARELGAEIGLNVMLGAEIRFDSVNDNDYLLYGIDEAFLRRNPYLHRLSPCVFYKRFGGEILIIQAHPYRNGNETVFTECIHGAEVLNGNPRHGNNNDKALALCASHPEYYRFGGSDAHRDGDAGSAWMLLDGPAADSHEFRAAIIRGGYVVGCPTGYIS